MAPVSTAAAMSNSDEEMLISSSEVSTVASNRRVAKVIGAFALVGCAAVAVATMAMRPSGTTTARQLLDDPDLHHVMANNIITVGDKMTASGVGDPAAVHKTVAETMKKYAANLSPADQRALLDTPITAEEKKALLHVHSYLSDSRAHSLGLKIAHAVRDAHSDDPEVLKNHIARSLAPHMQQMRLLRDEMFPVGSPLRATVADGRGRGFERLLSKKRIALMKSVDDAWDMHFDSALPLQDSSAAAQRSLQTDWTAAVTSTGSPLVDPAAVAAAVSAAADANAGGFNPVTDPVSSDTDNTNGYSSAEYKKLSTAKGAVGVAGAVAQEADAVLGMCRAMSKVFGKDLNVNPAVTTGIGMGAYATELGACELDAFADGANPLEVVGCPMEFGSELTDGMREMMTLTGILGDNNPANGCQGNHNNGKECTESPLLTGAEDDVEDATTA